MKPQHKIVLVQWMDSHSCYKWEDIEVLHDANTPLHCWSIGWLIDQNKDSICIVPHLSIDEARQTILQGSGNIVIPRKVIIKIKKINNI
jgi:hypothetical protein